MKVNKIECPLEEELWKYRKNTIADTQRKLDVERHVRDCKKCQKKILDWYDDP